MYQTRKAVEDNADKLSDDVKNKVEEAAKGVEEALKGEDIEAIKSAVEELSKGSMEMGKELYETQAAETGAEGDSDDDVVDAEVVDDEDNK